jgi:hypothetical protein
MAVKAAVGWLVEVRADYKYESLAFSITIPGVDLPYPFEKRCFFAADESQCE